MYDTLGVQWPRLHRRFYPGGRILLAAMVLAAGFFPSVSFAGHHFYTTSQEEVASLMGQGTWTVEAPNGIGSLFTLKDAPSGAVPLFRLFNKNNGDHLYTTSNFERTQLLAAHEWSDEGIIGFLPKTRPRGLVWVPLYRLYSGSQNDHFYTTSLAEVQSAVSGPDGYANEGIIGYLRTDKRFALLPLYRLYGTYPSPSGSSCDVCGAIAVLAPVIGFGLFQCASGGGSIASDGRGGIGCSQ